jgi:hypothetical protein
MSLGQLSQTGERMYHDNTPMQGYDVRATPVNGPCAVGPIVPLTHRVEAADKMFNDFSKHAFQIIEELRRRIETLEAKVG